MGAAILNREDFAVDIGYANASAVELADGNSPGGRFSRAQTSASATGALRPDSEVFEHRITRAASSVNFQQQCTMPAEEAIRGM